MSKDFRGAMWQPQIAPWVTSLYHGFVQCTAADNIIQTTSEHVTIKYWQYKSLLRMLEVLTL